MKLVTFSFPFMLFIWYNFDNGNSVDSGLFYIVYLSPSPVVNCVQCHPFDCAVATSGIDNTIKVNITKKEFSQISYQNELIN